jgi:hypothetical protein
MLIANVGWSEFYRGDGVEGDHEFLRKQGWGAERFNFLPGPGGRFYGYVRPVSGCVAKPPAPDDWLVVFVAKHPGHTGLRIVGWYEGASFRRQYAPRPEYGRPGGFRHTPDGDPFPYLIESTKAVLVPEFERLDSIDTKKMRRASIYYLRGGPVQSADRDRLARSIVRQLSRGQALWPKQREPLGSAITLDADRRREVEEESMRIAKAHFESRGYDVSDVSKRRGLGYDLFARKPEGDRWRGPRELLIEVKGTQGTRPGFIMTHGERSVMEDPINVDIWRLAMVTNVLSTPKIRELRVDDVLADFGFSPSRGGRRKCWRQAPSREYSVAGT